MKESKRLMRELMAKPGKKISLKDFDPEWTGGISDKKRAVSLLQRGVELLSRQQDRLYAQDTYGILIVFQAMDAAGKDGTIRHVMSGINPQGCQVFSFKSPSAEERDHDYLWRSLKATPERGRIGIHNRSYYEEVLVARVHPEILASQQLPDSVKSSDGIWRQRFEQINSMERYLVDNGISVLKFYLHISKKEQKKRFLARIDDADKNWKFSVADVKERGHWKDYMRAYEDVFTHTSTKAAPWYIIPANNKWFSRLAVAAIVYQTLEDLDLQYPKVSKEKHAELLRIRDLLLGEND
jgi:PPK2 family polyphosphate:nucleotide phosphotransferase